MDQRLKTTTDFFQAVKSGFKTAEIRSTADRSFSVGERIWLDEIDGDLKLTGDSFAIEITHIVTHEDFPQGLKPGYAMLSFH